MIISLPPVDPDHLTVGRRLRSIREARGFTLERLAAETRLARIELSMAEQGRARLDSGQVHAVTMALHISPRLLFEEVADLTAIRRL
jgi:transcriptional regulator with XRE-family HTH domain